MVDEKREIVARRLLTDRYFHFEGFSAQRKEPFVRIDRCKT
jgi:hypothetical protein